MRGKHGAIVLMVFILIAAFLLPAGAPSQAPASSPANQTILRFAYPMPAKRDIASGWEWLGPEFEKRTNGRYKVEYYPAQTLFDNSASFDSVLSNIAQITPISAGTFTKRIPLSGVTQLPGYDFPNELKARKAAGLAFMEMYQKMRPLQEEFKDLKVFGFYQLHPYILATKKKEVTLPEHFKGLRIGGTGYKTNFVSNNGGASVNESPPDIYLDLDKGVVDGSFVNWAQISIYKLWEVAKYYYDFSFGGGAFAMVMNLKTWDRISPEDQKIFMELWAKAYDMGFDESWAQVEKSVKATADAHTTIRKPTATEIAGWKKASQPIAKQWIEDVKKLGAKEAETVLAEWQKAIEAYK